MGKASRDKRDVYYRLAKEHGWRSRSAFKLLQLNEQFHFLDGVRTVVDLCAAPGGWSQVLCQRLCNATNETEVPGAKIVAVDIQEMAPYPFLETIQGDITKVDTVNQILNKFTGNRVDCVVCDGAPDVSGNNDMDLCFQAHLLNAARNITFCILKAGGSFVAKIFRGKNNSAILNQLHERFASVFVAKPRCSRNSSIEAFVVCLDFHPPISDAATLEDFSCRSYDKKSSSLLAVRHKTLFVACGKDSYDSDRTYSKQLGAEDYVIREPTQSPISPPYAESIKLLSNKTLYLSIAHERNADHDKT